MEATNSYFLNSSVVLISVTKYLKGYWHGVFGIRPYIATTSCFPSVYLSVITHLMICFFLLSKPNFQIPVNDYVRVCIQVSWMVHLNHLGHGC